MNIKKYALRLKVCMLICAAVFGYQKSIAQCQMIRALVTSTAPAADPVDSIIKICKGTTVTFSGAATFSGSGTGATYEWRFNDGTIQPGVTTTRNFPDEGVFVVDLVVTDANGCINKNCDSRRVIQVSTTPHFNLIQKPDTICLHRTASILGVVTPVDGIYNCAPPIADTTFLPDGSGVSYTTSIDVTCFTPCDTVKDSLDIESICINMEHSYLGDLDAKIICPNGQEASLFFTFGPATNQFLGQPNDPGPGDNIPGIGATYCFTSSATWGPFVNMLTNTTPVTGMLPGTSGNSMIPGNYRPQASYNNLIGCPLNGSWTIKITDHINSDNGYIFNWDITFSQDLGGYSFTPTYPNQSWLPHADIVATANGGKDITIRPESGQGLHCYTFKVIDGFNCPYDTTVCVYVIDPGNPGKDTTVKICLNEDPVNAFDLLGGTPDPGGTWSGSGVSAGGIFAPAVIGVGQHDVVYTQHKWNCDTTATITFNVVNDVKMDFNFDIMKGCTEDTVQFENLSEDGHYWWSFGDGTLPEDTLRDPLHNYDDQALYSVRLIVKNLDGCIDSLTKLVDVRHPLIAEFNRERDSVCQTDGIPVQFMDASTGDVTGWQWDFADGGNSVLENPLHTFTLAGTRKVRLVINDIIPCYDTVYHNIYVDSLPFLNMALDKHAICTGDKVNFTTDYLNTALGLTWSFGDGALWNQMGGTSHSFEREGTYRIILAATFPVCPTVVLTDSVVVKPLPVINLGPDSVLCLDGSAVRVTDINNASDPAVSWLWNTGATTSSIDVVHPGIYTVTATRNDCSNSGQVTVNKDCYTDIPNAFTPNGDGQNDYFYPRQLLSSGVSGFTMSIINRWGQKVFETTNISGRGWDGKFNDKDQPVGVYIYQIRAVMKNGRIEEYTGNVTLIR